MKRSEINDNILLALDVFKAHRFCLPKWAYWHPENWLHSGPEVQAIKDAMLGWDVTDFGFDNFASIGLVAFNLRNVRISGVNQSHVAGYAERIQLVQKTQVVPLHMHRSKSKDIIHRGGRDLLVQIYEADQEDKLLDQDRIEVHINGIQYRVKPGGVVRLKEGDSIHLRARLYHKFWAEKSGCMVGEISTENDLQDIVFHDRAQRFPSIAENEAPVHLLCNEYPDSGE